MSTFVPSELDLRLSRRGGGCGLFGFLLRLLLALLLLLLKLLLLLLLLLLLRHVVPDDAAGRGARDPVVTGDVSSHAANDGALDTALGCRGLRADEQCKAEQW